MNIVTGRWIAKRGMLIKEVSPYGCDAGCLVPVVADPEGRRPRGAADAESLVA
jgi:hypothetical protein